MTDSNGSPTAVAKEVAFGDVVADINESEREPLANGLENYVALDHIEPRNLALSEWGSLLEDEVSFAKRFSTGQVLFAKRRAYQRKVAIAPFDGICSSDILTFEPTDSRLHRDLLPFLVQSDAFFDHALDTSSGSLSPRTRWSQLKDFTFPLPAMEAQEQFVKVFHAIDEATRYYTKSVVQLRLLQHVAFRTAFESRLDDSSVCVLSDAIDDIVAGKSPVGSSEPAGESDVGVLKVSAVGKYGFVESENKALLNPDDFAREVEVESGFLLVTRANARVSGVGRSCLVGKVRSGLMLSDKTLRLVPKSETVLPRFLLQALRARICRRHIEATASGTEAKNISQARLKKSPIWLPNKNVQQIVVEFLCAADESISEIECHLARLSEVKRQVSATLMRGETLGGGA